MSYYTGSQRGSRDDLDDLYAQRHQGAPPRATPRQSQSSVNAPPRNPESGYAPPPRQPPGYDRQYERRPPPQPQERPAYYTPGSRQPPRSHSPQRYDERPSDQYMPARSVSPSSYQGGRDASPAARYQPRPNQSRSQSPGRTLDEGYKPRSQSPGRALDPPGYDKGAANAGYDQYSPQRPPMEPAIRQPPYKPPSSSQPASYVRHPPKQQYYQQQQQPPVRNYRGYQPMQDGRNRYAMQYSKPMNKSVTRDGGYYNVYTDAVIKTKKYKTKTGASTFLAVTRPWSKNHSNQPRDYMPLVIAAMFFNPLFGLAGLVLSCMTKRAVTQENWAKAGVYGRYTFWLSISAIILGVIFWIALIGAVHNDFFAPKLH